MPPTSAYLFTDEMHAKSFIADLEQGARRGADHQQVVVAMVGAGSDSWGYGGSGAAFSAASPLLSVTLPYLGVTQALGAAGLVRGIRSPFPIRLRFRRPLTWILRFDLAPQRPHGGNSQISRG